MELNREQIVKALEFCASPKQVCGDCPMPQDVKDDCRCMETISRNALALIRELTEENANLRLDVSSCKLERERNDSRSADLVAELAKEAETNLKLTEENERLRNRVTATVILTDKDAERIKKECLERVKLDIKAIQADTVRKMQERVLQLFPCDKRFTTISRFTIDKIAKEMLEEV